MIAMDNDNTQIAVDPQASLLRAHIEASKSRMLDGGGTPQDSYLFLSAPHEALPKLAFMDPVLNPIEKTIWANIWIYAKEQGSQGAGFPSHKILMSRCNIRQRKAVIRSITMLRLCRWITLCEQVRDNSGTVRGNIYALHDEPAPLSLTQQLDPEYMEFLDYCIRHHDRRISRAATGISAMINRELLQGRDLLVHDPLHQQETRLAAVSAILAREKGELPSKSRAIEGDSPTYSFFGSPVEPLLESKEGPQTSIEPTLDRSDKDHQMQNPHTENNRVQNLHSVISTPEAQKLPGAKSAHGNLASNHQVQNSIPGDLERSSSSSSIFLEKTTTTNSGGKNHQSGKQKPGASEKSPQALIQPPELTKNEYALALRRIQNIPPDEQQNVLDELGEQIRQRKDTSNPIRNPIGYLNWICQQLEQGKQPLSSAHLNRQERRRREAQQQAQEQSQAQKAEEELARLTEAVAQRKKQQ